MRSEALLELQGSFGDTGLGQRIKASNLVPLSARCQIVVCHSQVLNYVLLCRLRTLLKLMVLPATVVYTHKTVRQMAGRIEQLQTQQKTVKFAGAGGDDDDDEPVVILRADDTKLEPGIAEKARGCSLR
jgi:hypothetical protein